jgi:sporulation protein YlmC with PRC-barrel domain
LISLATAAAQQTPSADSTTPPATVTPQASVPVPGTEAPKLVGSARVSKLIGSKVYQGDTSIGEIEDVLVDLDHASVTAMVLSVGGFLGIGDKLVAIPVNQIKTGNEARFTSDLTKEQLTSARAFDYGKLE